MYKTIINSVSIARNMIEKHVKKGDIVLDATLGNGHDSLNLARAIGPDGKLYGFDIQEKAIENTRKKLEEEALDGKIHLIKDGHENIDQYISESLDFVIYNLGYLPGGDKQITTKKDTTIKSLSKALKLLGANGIIVVVSYLAHDGGFEENQALVSFLSDLSQKNYNVLECSFLNQVNSPPKVYIIEKSNKI